MACAARWSTHSWLGRAMLEEYRTADEDGCGLEFAIGCLWAAVKTSADGWSTSIRSVLRSISVLAAAALAVFEFGCGWRGIGFIITGHDPYYAAEMAGTQGQQAAAEAYRRAAPLFTTLLLAISSLQAILAWMLSRGYRRRARQVMSAICVAGLFMATISAATRMGSVAFAVYLLVPTAQWWLLHWSSHCSLTSDS